MVLEDGKDGYCEECDKRYMELNLKWCRPCQINYLKRNCINSRENENEEIDQFIQEMLSKIDSFNDIVFEWIPYSQFSYIKEISRDNYITKYSATWESHSLYFDKDNNKYVRDNFGQSKKVTLKYIHNLQITTNEFINKV
jgi:hypothetical protein